MAVRLLRMFRNRHRTTCTPGVAPSNPRRSATWHGPRVRAAVTVCIAVVAGSFITGVAQAPSVGASASPHGTGNVAFRVDASTNPPTVWLPYDRTNKIARIQFR